MPAAPRRRSTTRAATGTVPNVRPATGRPGSRHAARNCCRSSISMWCFTVPARTDAGGGRASGRVLQPAVSRRAGDAAASRRHTAAPGGADRRPDGPAHLGPDSGTASARARDRAGGRAVSRRHPLDLLQARLLSSGPGAQSAVARQAAGFPATGVRSGRIAVDRGPGSPGRPTAVRAIPGAAVSEGVGRVCEARRSAERNRR